MDLNQFTEDAAGRRRRNPTFGMTAEQAGKFRDAQAALEMQKEATKSKIAATDASFGKSLSGMSVPQLRSKSASMESRLGIKAPQGAKARSAFYGV